MKQKRLNLAISEKLYEKLVDDWERNYPECLTFNAYVSAVLAIRIKDQKHLINDNQEPLDSRIVVKGGHNEKPKYCPKERPPYSHFDSKIIIKKGRKDS